MSRAEHHPRWKRLDVKRRWWQPPRYATTHDFTTWRIGQQDRGEQVTIPAGFPFDSSVPWFLWWLISPDDPLLLLAALVHDWLLKTGRYGRTQAAAEWYDGALAGGASQRKARWGFLAVAFWAVFKRSS